MTNWALGVLLFVLGAGPLLFVAWTETRPGKREEVRLKQTHLLQERGFIKK